MARFTRRERKAEDGAIQAFLDRMGFKKDDPKRPDTIGDLRNLLEVTRRIEARNGWGPASLVLLLRPAWEARMASKSGKKKESDNGGAA